MWADRVAILAAVALVFLVFFVPSILGNEADFSRGASLLVSIPAATWLKMLAMTVLPLWLLLRGLDLAFNGPAKRARRRR
jgi:hypothetical protein